MRCRHHYVYIMTISSCMLDAITACLLLGPALRDTTRYCIYNVDREIVYSQIDATRSRGTKGSISNARISNFKQALVVVGVAASPPLCISPNCILIVKMALPTPSVTLYVSNLETKTKKPGISRLARGWISENQLISIRIEGSAVFPLQPIWTRVSTSAFPPGL